MNIQGTIRKISPSSKDSKRLSIQIDKDWFSLFTTDGKTNLNVGDMIEVDYVTKGNFNKLDAKTIKILGKSPIVQMVNEVRTDISKKIEMQLCLKASSSYSKTPDENIRNAKILYKSLKEEWE